ncbi:MAG TPA: histidine phosphatase family protein [Chloroflexota bacterium]
MIEVTLPTTVFLVRHAEVHNPQDILYGRLPRYRLSARGLRQARLTGLFLKGRSLDAIYTSPLLRARQTARIVADATKTRSVHQARGLIEVLTSFQGSPNSILKPGFSFYEPPRDPADESMQQVFDRMFAFLRLVTRRHQGGQVALISHADPITITRVGLQGLDLTAASLHSVVYAERSSVTQIRFLPDAMPQLSYFDPASLLAGR